MNVVRFDYDVIDSTNLEARRFWGRPETRKQVRQGQSEGTRLAWVFVAKKQEAGRGRLGRPWKSPAGGLWLSILWPLAAEIIRAQPIPLVAGLAVVDAIERPGGPPCRIKWPNDVLIKGRKVCGILCELEAGTQMDAVIIGIGINANFQAGDVVSPVSYPLTTLLEETGESTDLGRLSRDLVEGLTRALLEFETDGIAPFLPLINARLAWANAPVVVSGSEAGHLAGILRGIDGQGRLLVDSGGLLVPILTGDVRKMASED